MESGLTPRPSAAVHATRSPPTQAGEAGPEPKEIGKIRSSRAKAAIIRSHRAVPVIHRARPMPVPAHSGRRPGAGLNLSWFLAMRHRAAARGVMGRARRLGIG